MEASDNGETEIVTLLLDRGANIEAKSSVRIPQHNTVFHSVFLTTCTLRRMAGRP
jgi:ankyrin repeat protein